MLWESCSRNRNSRFRSAADKTVTFDRWEDRKQQTHFAIRTFRHFFDLIGNQESRQGIVGDTFLQAGILTVTTSSGVMPRSSLRFVQFLLDTQPTGGANLNGTDWHPLLSPRHVYRIVWIEMWRRQHKFRLKTPLLLMTVFSCRFKCSPTVGMIQV